jgi:hypothetical protein
MRLLLSLALLLATAGMAYAECKGRVVTRPNKQGAMREVCLDGKYSTCIRDSRQGGWTQAEAKAFCDGRKAAGAVK